MKAAEALADVCRRFCVEGQHDDACQALSALTAESDAGGRSGTCTSCGERMLLTDWQEHRELVHGSRPLSPGGDLIGTCPDGSRCQAPQECVAARTCTRITDPTEES